MEPRRWLRKRYAGEISKILSLLDLDPNVQKIAREDETGTVTKRHLYAVLALPPEKQQALIRRIQSEKITVDEVEQIAAREKDKSSGLKRRGAPVSHHRFRTTLATVSLTFRKEDVTSTDILEALSVHSRSGLHGR